MHVVRSLLVNTRGYGPWLKLQEIATSLANMSSPVRLKSATQCMSQYDHQRKDVKATTRKTDLALHPPTGSKSEQAKRGLFSSFQPKYRAFLVPVSRRRTPNARRYHYPLFGNDIRANGA